MLSEITPALCSGDLTITWLRQNCGQNFASSKLRHSKNFARKDGEELSSMQEASTCAIADRATNSTCPSQRMLPPASTKNISAATAITTPAGRSHKRPYV